MTGPDHYREAERLQRHAAELAKSWGNLYPPSSANYAQRAAILADAQIHATLAVAAVFGLSASLNPADKDAWQAVAATRRDEGGPG